ncbi:hypothetical protein EDB83DRAFT_2547369 [Lactarius deliciosus]|nr:hypothetical protein EDB83DRAFT_2547369 [Lactarius deliciosus]
MIKIRRPKVDFSFGDLSASVVYYGNADECDREDILSPPRKKRKAGVKVRATNALPGVRVHASNPLTSVRPLTSILDNTGIKKLSRLLPTEVTGFEQVVSALDGTGQLYKVIRAYGQELEDVH